MADMFDLVSKALSKTFAKKNISFGLLSNGDFLSEPKERISTGITLLDAAIRGGIPIGRTTELFGSAATGKSLLATHILAHAQQAGCIIVLNDTEAASSVEFIQRMARVRDLKNFYWLDAPTLEDMFDATNNFIDAVREVELNLFSQRHEAWAKKKPKEKGPEPVLEYTPIVFLNDSLAMLPTKNETLRLVDEPGIPGEAAKKIRLGFRILTRKMAHQRVAFIFTNHETSKIGAAPWQEKFATYGGTGGMFGASVRLRLESVGKIKENDRLAGMKCRITVYKSRFDAPGQQIDVPIYFKDGVHDIESIVDFLHFKHFFGTKKGWFQYNDRSYRRQDFVREVEENKDLRKAITEEAVKLFHSTSAIEYDPEVVEGA